MDYGIFELLKLIGSLGVFLYGMKLMSESLQKLAGNKMRQILTAMTSNRVTGVLTGIFITALIQSSSATTVMVVSFVNAGLLDLVGSIGVILGANVGTTVTSWLVAVLGLGKFSMSDLALPIIGCTLPLLFSKKRSRKNWGEMFVGFGLLFLALRFLQESMPTNLHDYPGVGDFIQKISFLGFRSWMIFLLIGAVLTTIFQSSSATVALTLVICSKGWIGYEDAAAMIMGENIGTTITANLAAAVANVQAKRAALAHFIINVFGVIWLFAIFTPFLHMIGDLCVTLHISRYNPIYSDPALLRETFSPEARAGVTASINAAMPLVLSLFNTLAKGINVTILIWFTQLLAKIVSRIIPPKAGEDTFKLKHIKIGLLSTPDASLFQAKQEISLYGQNTLEMYHKMVQGFDMPRGEYEKMFEQLQQMEDESDVVEVEIADYLTKVSESKLSTENSQRVRAMFKIVSEIESVADSILNVAKAINRRNEQNIPFPEALSNKLKHMFTLIDDSIVTMCSNLNTEYTQVNSKKAYSLEQAINDYRTILKQEHLIAVEEKRYDYSMGIIYADMFSECEKIGDYTINVTQAIKEIGHDE
ncbi:Na/Pi cotransporter family protein [Odoribacter sp. Z80]|uniref:Na/Pi cotransporter family protein n=1 Tax=Odoribacter sp. Z80 TaxID=2304575 RepID=UPI00137A31EE|nr:Na/Pi cotransporter family protein [Odoribacter sp. Z80]NCE72110.1 Na/Pi cotransporter family protein [Odoribacter sp. Z80]